MRDDWKILRAYSDARRDAAGDPAGSGSPGFLGKVLPVATPGATLGPGKFFEAWGLRIGGDEVEGGTATFGLTSTHRLPIVARGAAPVPGTAITASYVDDRWVMDAIAGNADPCLLPVTVRLRDAATGGPIAGALVSFRAPGSGAVLFEGTTDEEGEYVSPSFPRNQAHTLHLEIASKFDGLVARFDFTQFGARPCGQVREFDFCEAKINLQVTDSGSGAGQDGFWRGPGIEVPPGAGSVTIAPAAFGSRTACDSPPPRSFEYAEYLTRAGASGGTYSPSNDPGIAGNTYSEVYFAIKERPYSDCPPRYWHWTASKGPNAPCDNDGRYKNRCGKVPLECGAEVTVPVAMFPLGTEWTGFNRFGDPSCGTGCSDLGTGTETNGAIGPDGLLRKTLYVTATVDDAVGTVGALLGVPVEVRCAGTFTNPSNGATALRYVSDPTPNEAGGYQCCEVNPYSSQVTNCTAEKFKTTAVTLLLYPSGGVQVSWTNGPEMECVTGKVPTAVEGRGFTASAGGRLCTPTLLAFSARTIESPFADVIFGDITE